MSCGARELKYGGGEEKINKKSAFSSAFELLGRKTGLEPATTRATIWDSTN